MKAVFYLKAVKTAINLLILTRPRSIIELPERTEGNPGNPGENPWRIAPSKEIEALVYREMAKEDQPRRPAVQKRVVQPALAEGKPAIAIKPEKPKEPWQMTKEEYLVAIEEAKPTFLTTQQDLVYREMLKRDKLGRPAGHKTVIQRALAAGKTVPAEVLKDYPDLAKVTPKAIEPHPPTLAEYKASPYWQKKEAEYSKRIKPYLSQAEVEIKKVNDTFMAGKTSLGENQAQRDAINAELDKQADRIRIEMGFLPKASVTPGVIASERGAIELLVKKPVINVEDRAFFQKIVGDLAEAKTPDAVARYYPQLIMGEKGDYFQQLVKRYNLPTDILKLHERIKKLVAKPEAPAVPAKVTPAPEVATVADLKAIEERMGVKVVDRFNLDPLKPETFDNARKYLMSDKGYIGGGVSQNTINAIYNLQMEARIMSPMIVSEAKIKGIPVERWFPEVAISKAEAVTLPSFVARDTWERITLAQKIEVIKRVGLEEELVDKAWKDLTNWEKGELLGQPIPLAKIAPVPEVTKLPIGQRYIYSYKSEGAMSKGSGTAEEIAALQKQGLEGFDYTAVKEGLVDKWFITSKTYNIDTFLKQQKLSRTIPKAEPVILGVAIGDVITTKLQPLGVPPTIGQVIGEGVIGKGAAESPAWKIRTAPGSKGITVIPKDAARVLAKMPPKSEAGNPRGIVEDITYATRETKSKEEDERGKGCIACSINHLSTCSGLLSESLRFARGKDVGVKDVTERLGLCQDELNAMERVDLRAEKIVELEPQEKQIADDILTSSRLLRHALENINEVSELEDLTAQMQKLRTATSDQYYAMRRSRLLTGGKGNPDYPVYKDPWLMTQREWFEEDRQRTIRMKARYGEGMGEYAEDRPDLTKLAHKRIIKKALSEGRSVPVQVLKDYPDLVKTTHKAEAGNPGVTRVGWTPSELSPAVKRRAEAFLDTKTYMNDPTPLGEGVRIHESVEFPIFDKTTSTSGKYPAGHKEALKAEMDFYTSLVPELSKYKQSDINNVVIKRLHEKYGKGEYGNRLSEPIPFTPKNKTGQQIYDLIVNKLETITKI